MSQHDDDVRLQHMLDAPRQALAFVKGRSRVDLELSSPWTCRRSSRRSSARDGDEEERSRDSRRDRRATWQRTRFRQLKGAGSVNGC
jgi:hypothetical protein